MDFLKFLLSEIKNFHILGYGIIFLAALLETTIGIGMFIPGSTIVLFIGALAAKGYFEVGELLWFAVIGAILGDNINYFIGKKYSSKFFYKNFWFIKPIHLKKGKKFFKRHGSKSVFLGRFIPVLKEVTPLIAGTFGMNRLPFMIWDFLGATCWGLIWVFSGYYFAQSLDFIKIWLGHAGIFLAIFLCLFILLYILKNYLMKKNQ